MPAEEKKRLDAFRTKHGATWGQLIVKGMDAVEGHALEAGDQYGQGFAAGRKVGAKEGRGIVVVPGSVCGKPVEIDLKSSKPAAEQVRGALASWDHAECIDRAPAPLSEEELAAMNLSAGPYRWSGPFNLVKSAELGMRKEILDVLREVGDAHDRIRENPEPLLDVIRQADPGVVRSIPPEAISTVARWNWLRQQFASEVDPIGVPFVPESVAVVRRLQRSDKDIRDLRDTLADNLAALEARAERTGKSDSLQALALALQYLRIKILIAIRKAFVAANEVEANQRRALEGRTLRILYLKGPRGRLISDL